ncbi:large ribosomal subunit protein uL2cz/uL2cy-like [Cornus florida]|uniref:large ribosomal subunit protein uL2cz/uL2cy-like n=1 Tax=Cornus florida TaxID=4283 RepID=UPI00289E3989|nr:large ribosomal subunit protein uL2cz/uL2cy-like [Cornus florida]
MGEAPSSPQLYKQADWLNHSLIVLAGLGSFIKGSRNMSKDPSVQISSSTSRKPYTLEEACIVWEGVFIDQKEESTSTDLPLGRVIHNIEITLGKGGQLARVAGAIAKLIAKEEKSATLKLPFGEVRLISKNCSATIGQVGNVGVNQKSLGRAGSKCWLGKPPVVRGVIMNLVDHPHGCDEGSAPVGRKKPTTPRGYPALGRRSRKRNKYSDNLILRRRSK